VAKRHHKYAEELGIAQRIEAYIQSVAIKKTLESISFEYRYA